MQLEFHTVNIPFGSLRSERNTLKQPLLSLALTGTDGASESPKASKAGKKVSPVPQRHLLINGTADSSMAESMAEGEASAKCCCVVS